MSEELIKAILQLFAIVAKEDGVQKEERSNIEEFLAENLDEEAVTRFMEWMDQYVSQSYGSKTSTMGGSDNITQDYAAIDLNCSRLNRELTHQQKMVLMLKMLELILADGSISDRESRLVEHACDALKVNREEVDLFKSYVLSHDVQDINSGDLLIINSDNVQPPSNTKHLVVANFPGFVAVLRIPEIETYFIKYEGDAPINLNGVPLKHRKIQVFPTGSTIRSQDTDPIYYSDVVSKFLSTESDSKISFIAENLSFKFPNGAIGLRDFSIAEESGKLIGIMGGSGSGKTTLLNVLNGEASPSQGKVLINQIDIHRQPDQIRGVIGYVPQDDLLMEDLTVFQNLYFAARLCFSGQSKRYLEKLVLDTLKSLGLLETKDLKVGNPLQKTISGGQRKRVNIGLELLREPSILFLDEPTSGLSSRDSENIMDLLNELSLKGKMIFVVIHQPSADIFKMFDKLVILDVGGYQIYYGNPIDAESYFKNVANLIEKDTDFGVIRPEQVFNIIERKVVNEYGRFTDHRKISPKKWYEYFKEKTKIPSVQAVEDEPRTTFKIPDRLKQLTIFTQRDLLSKISNRQYLLINLFEAPLLAFLLAYIVRFYPILGHGEHHYLFSKNVNIPAYFFMSIIVALFMGLTVSAEEIIKDRKILKRESFLHLSRSSYLFSKMLIMFGFSAIQTFLFVMIGDHILEIDGMNLTYWMILFSTSCFANLLGLNISATFNSAITIYILIPLLLIPQLILSGVVVKFDKLNPHITSEDRVPWIGELMTSRWAFEAVMVSQFKDNPFESQFYPYDKIMANANYKDLYHIPALQTSLDYCLNHLNKAENPEVRIRLRNNFLILRNEFPHEFQTIGNSHSFVESLTIKKFDSAVFLQADNFLQALKRFYANKYNKASQLKDQLVVALNQTPEKRETFGHLREEFQNESIGILVKNTSEPNRIIEEDGHLIQKIYPIYMDPAHPEHLFDFREQFFLPQKHFLGMYFDTLHFNLYIIWMMIISLTVTLYYDVFRKMISPFEHIQRLRKL